MNASRFCPAHWKNLLVCTDGSEAGRHAVSEALALAGACGSRVHVLRVIEIVPEFEAVAPDLRSLVAAEVREDMKSVQAEAAALGAAVEILVPQSPQPYAEVVAQAEKSGADVIIMGRSGRSALSRVLMGSVTARVIGYSPVKVLVLPPEASLGFGRLLVASDGSPASVAAWEEALTLAGAAPEARLWALVAAREEGEILEARGLLDQLLAAANRAGLPLQGLSPEGQQPDDAIVQAALRNGIELVIMGSHGRTGLRRLLMGGVTARVIGQAPCPVLVVKEK
jgi:hypothetical protein